MDRGYTKEEIKKMTRKRPHIQEEQFDDCGSDTTFIEGDPNTALLLTSPDINDMMEGCFRMEEEPWEG